MAGRQAPSGRTRSYKTTTASTRASSSTRRFSTVSSSSSSRARLAREKQRRQYEQQKREKLIFALFVVIILVMILFSILIFKKIVGDAPSDTTEDVGGLHGVVDPPDTDPITPVLTFKEEMVAKDRIYQGSLILVNSTTPRKIAPALTDLSAVSDKAYQMSGLGTHLETAAADAFVKMATDEYAATGTKLLVHRCYEEDKASDELGSGLTVDVAVYDGSSTYSLSSSRCAEVLSWMKDNAARYGFVILSPEETGKTHYGFRYVGVPHASYMEENELTLAAHLEAIRNHTPDTPLSVVIDGVHYAMYYVEATGGDMTAVPILKDAASFEISGDNAGGFIVTARMD